MTAPLFASGARPRRIAPSDVPGNEDVGPIEIAGRVLTVLGRSLCLGDAFFRVRVTLAEESPLAPGDLAVIAGSLAGGELTAAAVIERITPARPPRVSAGPPPGHVLFAHALCEDAPRSETERLALSGGGRGLAARAAGLSAIRRFFDARGFIEVDTPAIVPSPGLDLH